MTPVLAKLHSFRELLLGDLRQPGDHGSIREILGMSGHESGSSSSSPRFLLPNENCIKLLEVRRVCSFSRLTIMLSFDLQFCLFDFL